MSARLTHYRSPSGLRAAILLALAAALASSALADVVVLDDGRRIEGTVTSETKTKVIVETRFGKMEFLHGLEVAKEGQRVAMDMGAAFEGDGMKEPGWQRHEGL